MIKPVAKKKRAAPKKEVPAAEKKAMEVTPGDRLVAGAIEKLLQNQAAVIEELKDAINNIQLQTAQPVLDWDFQFIRDELGMVEHIKAHAIIDQKTIN